MSFVPKAELELEGKPAVLSKLIFKIGVVCAIGLFVGMVVYNATTELKVVKVMKYAQYENSEACAKRDDEVYCYNNENDIVINIASVHAMDEELDFAYDEDQRAAQCGDCRATCPANGYVREFGVSEPFEDYCVLCTKCTVCSSACLVDSTSSKVTLFTRVAEEYIVALAEGDYSYDAYSVSNFKLIINFAAFLKDEDACSFKLLVGDDIYYSGFENLKILSFVWEPEERTSGSLYYLLEGLTVKMEYFGANAVQTDDYWPTENVVMYDPDELLPIFLSSVDWDVGYVGGQDFSCGQFSYPAGWISEGSWAFAADTQTGGASADVNCNEIIDKFAMLFNLEYFARSQSASLVTQDPAFIFWQANWDADNGGGTTGGARRLFFYSPSNGGYDGYGGSSNGGSSNGGYTSFPGGSDYWGFSDSWTWDSGWSDSWSPWGSEDWTSTYLPPSLSVFFDDYYSTDLNEALKAPSSWTKSSAYIKALCKASFRLETNKGNVVGFRQETYFPEVVDAMSLALPWTITFWNGCTAVALVIVSKLHQQDKGDTKDEKDEKPAEEGPAKA